MNLKLCVWNVVSSALLVFAVLAPGLPAQRAFAQSESDLRRQNQELTTKVKDLEAELDAARKQADALQKRITALESQLAAKSPVTGHAPIPPLEEEPVSIDESHANASPRALLNAVVESYRKAVTDLPMGQKGDRERAAYMRVIERWKGATEREYRMPIDWHVRVQPASMLDSKRERIATFIAVDPVTGTRLGDEFDVALSRSMAKRLEELDNRNELGTLVMKGTVITQVRINLDRESRGSFDSPRFVGPFAEFEFTVEPSSIVPYKPAAATQPATPTVPATP